MAHLNDRWYSRPGPGGRRQRTDRYGRGLRWQAEWIDGAGKRRRRSFEHKYAAEVFVADLRAAAGRGVYTRGSDESVADVARAWLEAQLHHRPSTRAAVERRLRLTILPELGHRPVAAVRPSEIQAAVAKWAGELAPGTLRVTYAYVSTIFRYALDLELIPRSPCLRIRLPQPDRVLVEPMAPEAVVAMAEALPEPWATMAWIIAATGLRGGEARGLTWPYVHETHLRIERQSAGRGPDGRARFGPPKTGSSRRSVAIGPMTHQLLLRLRESAGEGPDRLVFHNGGRAVSKSTMEAAWARERDRLGLGLGERAGWHLLRHYHASELIAAGLSPVAVAHRLGHRDATETLATYAHLWPEDDATMAAAGERLLGPLWGSNVVSLPSVRKSAEA